MTSTLLRSRAKRSITSERLGTTSYPVLATALHHARRDDLQRAVLLVGYAVNALFVASQKVLPICLQVQQRVRDRAAATHPAATIDAWLHAGEHLTEEQAAAIAFDDAPLAGVP